MQRLHSLPHHDGSALYSPGDGTTLGAARTVRVRVPRSFGPVTSVALRVLIDGEPRFTPMTTQPNPALTGDDATWWTGQLTVDNPVTTYRFLLNLLDGSALWLNAEGVDSIEPVDTQDFRVTTFPRPPAWATSQVLYQVFPDRFAKSTAAETRPAPSWALPAAWDDTVVHTGPDTPRQFFGGDLDGLTERLDHLTDLGVTLLYLTPIFPARSNHRYDASTFDQVDPLLGGDEALIRLVEAAHTRGIRVIGDLTTNHTGDAHEWFTTAHHAPGTPESEFYYWNDDANDDYVAWADVPSLPKLNWNSAELRRRFVEGPTSVVARWLLPPFHLDGWRIDVANQTGRLGTDDLNRDVQRTVRATMDAVSSDTVLYAESTNEGLLHG
ncbi:alpha-amylase family glycosyl hydrolase [Sanguibacter sp. A247]|uniref:alpha-amylase family glycosyl hydrolase n=1 Tax=Sanguibacter sp. A247 TaxID=3457327 RepID=UPI003FD75C8F